ncbi:MAG: ATP-binding protein, partial [Saprospiraceae bacterium]|nr:ATP-binding protein [Saprospiraceae bacterium]
MQIENPDMPQQNKITVAGDGNITIQDVNNSTIHLNANDPAILGQLEALQQSNAAAFLSLMEELKQRHEAIFLKLQGTQSKLPKDLSLNIPKVHPDDVVGREDDLKNLHDLLFDNKRVVVVNGLGGLGKTTLAQAYIGQYYTEYRHVLWISQLSEDLINDTINAEGLTKQLHINTEGQDPQAIFLEIISRLKSIGDSPNLLVIDNAEASLARLYDLLPAQPDWHVLVTSREKIERFFIKELDFLSPEQALALFKKHCSRIEAEAAIQSILKTIDYHTLTIEILAKTAQKQRTPIAELQSAIQNDLQANIYIPHKGEKIDKVRAYLASIFDFSRLSSDEAWLLQQFLCLPGEYHTYASLEELIDPAASERRAIFSETLEELVAKGWLLHNTATDSYKMHRIIAEVASEKLPLSTDAVMPLIKIVTQKLSLDQTKDNPVDKFP